MLVNITVLWGDLLETQSQMREVHGNNCIARLSGCEWFNGAEWTAEKSNFLLKSKFKIKLVFSIFGGKIKDKGRPKKREKKRNKLR